MDAPRPWTRGSPAPSMPASGPSLLAPRPPQLRPSRSATNLMASAHRPQEQGVVDHNGNYLVDFVVDELPTPGGAGLLIPPHSAQQVRRVKSSTELGSASTVEESKGKDESKWKNALGEAQYFAGGLISHPAESTKHYSIIRHSRALVWYRGPATSVSITILADSFLPPTRTLWLQQKGFSGNMGMSLKALIGTNGDWIEVTPASKAGPEHIDAVDERGIQRDIKRFMKKASGRAASHVPRETHVVRIPATAVDGYFRLVLCCGDEGNKKVLCGSPVFRIASTSTDPTVVRGASLSTMPLEMGVKVASTVGQQVAKKYTGVVGAVVQSKAARALPNAAVKKAANAAYQRSGIGTTVSESWKAGKAGRYDPIVQVSPVDGPVEVVGSDEGPEKPFPLPFEGRTVQGTGWSTCALAVPTANLREVPDEIKMRMKGVFAAWACLVPGKGLEELSHDWHEAIVTIAPYRNARPGVVIKNKVAVHFIHDFEFATFFDAKVKVVLMAHLHPPNHDDDPDVLLREHAQDLMVTLATLGRDNWGPVEAVSRIKTLKSERSFQERLDGATGKVQKGVDRIPLHWAGVRSESAASRDQVYGIGGLWIPR
ncbi:riboflavin kinase domain-containing protein [Sarocladium implicatum]|nr:riboflavin kinase domain-containing protein [Sarocladium implicatum]